MLNCAPDHHRHRHSETLHSLQHANVRCMRLELNAEGAELHVAGPCSAHAIHHGKTMREADAPCLMVGTVCLSTTTDASNVRRLVKFRVLRLFPLEYRRANVMRAVYVGALDALAGTVAVQQQLVVPKLAAGEVAECMMHVPSKRVAPCGIYVGIRE